MALLLKLLWAKGMSTESVVQVACMHVRPVTLVQTSSNVSGRAIKTDNTRHLKNWSERLIIMLSPKGFNLTLPGRWLSELGRCLFLHYSCFPVVPIDLVTHGVFVVIYTGRMGATSLLV